MHSRHSDWLIVAVSLLVLASLVAIAFALARSRRLSSSVLRKALHAAVGTVTLVVTPMFHHRGWALVLPALFLGVNASPQARPLFLTMAETPERARGLWTFPAGVILVYLLFWDEGSRPAILAGLAALAFADPAAAIVGARLGQRRFGAWGHGRSLEGSLTFLLVAGIAVGVVACQTAAAHASGVYPWRMAIACGAAGALAEAVTPSGWDNVAIPVAVAAAYHALA